MKAILTRSLSIMALSLAGVSAQTTVTYSNFIRQVQMPSGVEWDITGLAPSGERESQFSVENDGARFELWTIKSSPVTPYLLDSKFVGAYIPGGALTITSDDPYGPIPRTRADKPFYVKRKVTGLQALINGILGPLASRSVLYLHHSQSYGTTGFGEGINRALATLVSQISLTENLVDTENNGRGIQRYTILSGSGGNIRGEERFSIFSVADILAPSSQLASQYIQILPITTGDITGIENEQTIGVKVLRVDVSAKNLYPGTTTSLQIYPGPKSDEADAKTIPASVMMGDINKPKDDSRTVDLTAEHITSDGKWTLELVTATPWGVERLKYVTFNVSRNLQVNSMIGTME